MRQIRLGKGFSTKGDKIHDNRHKLGSVSQRIKREKRAKAGKGRVVSPAKAAMAMRINRP